MLSLDYSSPTQNALIYNVGHALTMYLDWKNPETLKDYLTAIRNGADLNYANRILYQHYNNKQFETFLTKHSTETEMKNVNALKIERGEKIATIEEIIGNQYQNVTYYKTNIRTMDNGEIVGSFSPVFHNFIGCTIRVTSVDIRSYFDLSQQYNFLKVVRYKDKLQLIHCDKNGNTYKDSQEYQKQANRIKKDYYSDIDYQNIIEQLTYFDLNSVRSIKKQNFLNYFLEGQIFKLNAPGIHEAKSISGISIYSDKIKIGELSGDATYIKVTRNNEVIIHDDRLMKLIKYPAALHF